MYRLFRSKRDTPLQQVMDSETRGEAPRTLYFDTGHWTNPDAEFIEVEASMKVGDFKALLEEKLPDLKLDEADTPELVFQGEVRHGTTLWDWDDANVTPHRTDHGR